MRDKLSEQRLQKLHPKVRATFKAFIEDCEGLDTNTVLRITAGLRTDKEQDALYAQGRTTPGPKVTNAKAGQSYHNYGLAIDLVELDGEKNEIADWKFDMATLKPIADRHGIVWGGTFRSIKDKPHFQIDLGYTVSQLRDTAKDAHGYPLL